MAGEKLNFKLEGGSPWGFRLFGGEDEPLIIAKVGVDDVDDDVDDDSDELRKRSKAAEAGLQEEDVLLSINGFTCKGMSHATAMGLVDSAGSVLSLIVLRGANPGEISGAFETTGNLRQAPSQNTYTAQSIPAQTIPATDDNTISATRQQHITQEGDTTTKVITDTAVQQLGDTTVTRITTKTESHTIGAPEDVSSGPQFSGSEHSKPAVWSPGGVTVQAPEGVSVSQNDDQSVTMTLGLNEESKENVSPQIPNFNVSKVTTQSTKWQPGSAPLRPMQPQQQQPSQPQQAQWHSQTPQQPPPQRLPWNIQSEIIQRHKPGQHEVESPEPTEDDKMPIKWAPPRHVSQSEFDAGSMSDSSNSGRPPNIEIKPIALSKLIKEGSGSDEPSTPESPSSWKKKRFYADSSFYNDPSGKFPTLEEQVKMARKVALSLTAPVNLDARGHKMFIKRKEKSRKWTSKSKGKEGQRQEESEESDDEPYYKPEPWKHGGKPVSSGSGEEWEPNTPADDSDLHLFRPPVIPKAEDPKTALSPEEFERMRLYDEKNIHDNVSPQACFDLAQALKNAKGKSGKMFQKRKQRMDKYTTDESNVKHAPPTPIINQEKHYAELGPPGQPTNRLKEMLEMPKPKMTPWEAALESEHGHVDKAFDHLRQYEAQKITQITPSQKKAAPPPPPKPESHVPIGPSVPPQGENRAARPWTTSTSKGKPQRPVSAQFSNGVESAAPSGWRSVSTVGGPGPASGPPPQQARAEVQLQFTPQAPPSAGGQSSSAGPSPAAPVPAFAPPLGPRPQGFSSVRFDPSAKSANYGGGYPGSSATLPRSIAPRMVAPPSFCDL